jgi:protein-tyrosine phosphatase
MVKKKILFVCLGNICRSPAAEAIFTHLVEQKGLSHLFEIDSAGLNGYHNGEPADSRMIKEASGRGYKITSISRKVDQISDFQKYDMLIGMDNSNYNNLKRLAAKTATEHKVYRMVDFDTERKYTEVPDPYYGGREGFQRVLDILEECSNGLIKKMML